VRTTSKSLMATVVLLVWAFPFLGEGRAHSLCLQEPSNEFTPKNTVLLANQTDARFTQDYSVLLKSLRLEWAIVDSAAVPDWAKDKHLILVGRVNAAYTGEILRRILTPEELETIGAAGDEHVVLAKASPWAEDRRVYICTGEDLLLARNAAEEAIRGIMAGSPPASAWIRTRFDAPLDERVRDTVDRLRHTWDDAELPLAELRMDVGTKPRRRTSAEQAAQDVERLFYLFSHGYGGYAFFNQEGEFARAKARILEEITSRRTWSTQDLSQLLYERLGFITDFHLKIGDHPYAGHVDFWYDTDLELTPGKDGYEFEVEGERYEVVSVNRQDPESFVFPSLNEQGEPIYRLGTLSKTEPVPLVLVTARDAEPRQFEIALQRSDFNYLSDDVFREDNLGGIPVLRVRSFGDVHQDELRRFVETARAHKDEPVIVVDVRGNGGGNEKWPVQWIQGLTGRRAESVFIVSELHSKTTMAGRANLFAHYDDLYPDVDTFRQDLESTTHAAQAYEDGTRQPGWTGPRYPQIPLIPNDTTVIIVMNDLVASAGEGLIMRASQMESVVLVGENSMGALTFGNISTHQLPHSRLKVTLPINFNLYLDRESREGKGISPDLWVPAADAVNYAVAAVRAGTITTQQPLSPTTLEQPFVPEDAWAMAWQETISRWPVIAALTLGGSVWAYFLRKKPRTVAGAGGLWLIFGGVWMLMERSVGLGFLLAGGVCLLWGGLNLLRARKAPVDTAA
jgi:C-terminal processing protease CtpA/Prc